MATRHKPRYRVTKNQNRLATSLYRTDEAEISTCLARVGPKTVPPLCTVATALAHRQRTQYSLC